ncbi:MAG: ATP-binding cassette domain-containing protein [Bacteroidota bacterium]|nr:ATP-binding cassette domain-containing protein [Bacteroidota bacterium]
MIRLTLQDTGKRFNREWIFRSLNITLQQGDNLAILGANGSGKSTLARVMSGFMIPSAGNVIFEIEGNVIDSNACYRHLSYAAPYLDLPEEFTLSGMLDFHRKFKPIVNDLSTPDLIARLGMEQHAHKPIVKFSSGMKQRVKLLLAVLTRVPLTFLDEPTVNLDDEGIEWYRNLLAEYADQRILVICSNHQIAEHDFCPKVLHLSDYKS